MSAVLGDCLISIRPCIFVCISCELVCISHFCLSLKWTVSFIRTFFFFPSVVWQSMQLSVKPELFCLTSNFKWSNYWIWLWTSAVGSFSKILQFSISHNAYDDSYGIFWSCSIFPCSCIQGETFQKLLALLLQDILRWPSFNSAGVHKFQLFLFVSFLLFPFLTTDDFLILELKNQWSFPIILYYSISILFFIKILVLISVFLIWMCRLYLLLRWHLKCKWTNLFPRVNMTCLILHFPTSISWNIVLDMADMQPV